MLSERQISIEQKEPSKEEDRDKVMKSNRHWYAGRERQWSQKKKKEHPNSRGILKIFQHMHQKAFIFLTGINVQ